jgi:type II secretory ATPase GspE/PulE/Tfp pilus assembly ATPase PilB-like protein
MADMNIAERRRPLDCSFTDTLNGKDIDFRVATIGTSWGESAVLRVLDKSFNLFELEQIGMPEYLRGTYEAALASPFGMIIMSGPTGSGKTTTLYGSLLKLNIKEFNIMSIEDPIEYKFEGVRQIQVNLAAGITFASGLRASMRMDPDVILVGEIRDRETAQTAITAALTGHLVLSSIHANDAVGALIRLVDLGVEPFLVTSGVIATASQRLVRRVCPHCAELKQAPSDDIEAYKRVTGEEKTEFYYGAGCNQCSSTGYHGRIGVFELLPVTDSIKSLVTKQAGVTELKEQAQKDGMLPMSYHGMSLVKEGVTTPSEVTRNVFTIG